MTHLNQIKIANENILISVVLRVIENKSNEEEYEVVSKAPRRIKLKKIKF